MTVCYMSRMNYSKYDQNGCINNIYTFDPDSKGDIFFFLIEKTWIKQWDYGKLMRLSKRYTNIEY